MFLNISVLNNLDFLRFWRVLKVLGRSGRLVGRISINFRRIPSGGFRAMTKKPNILTTKKATTIYMWAYLITCFGFVGVFFGYTSPLFSLHLSSRNLPKYPLNSPEDPLKYPSKIPWKSHWIDYLSTQVQAVKKTPSHLRWKFITRLKKGFLKTSGPKN